jgi:sulfoxide reductase heme-binding subunit YedZ
MGAFVLLMPLAATSNGYAVRLLGFRRWQRLHRAVYLAGTLGVLHYLCLVKVISTRPLVYALLFSFMLGLRMISRHSGKSTQ